MTGPAVVTGYLVSHWPDRFGLPAKTKAGLPPGWRDVMPAEEVLDPGGNPRATSGETGTPAGDRWNPRPSGRGVVNRQQWCTCGAVLKATDSPEVARQLSDVFWRHHSGTGHQTTDRITAARVRRHRKALAA